MPIESELLENLPPIEVQNNISSINIATTVTTTVNMTNTKFPGDNQSNLRDIGTWSNEQAASNGRNNRNRSLNQNRNQTHSANRFSSNKANDKSKDEDWENDEEWQGDLTQTQIFTPSSQKKEEQGYIV